MNRDILGICNAYESGYWDGYDKRNLQNPYAYAHNTDEWAAWDYGYSEGANKRDKHDLLADDLQISVKIEQSRSPATDEYESYLVIRAKGKTQPYLYIPDSFDDEVLDEIIDRMNERC